MQDATQLAGVKLSTDTQLAVANMQETSKRQLADAAAQNSALLNTNSNAASLLNNTLNGIANISASAVDGAGKQVAVDNMLNVLRAGLQGLGEVSNLDLSRYFQGVDIGGTNSPAGYLTNVPQTPTPSPSAYPIGYKDPATGAVLGPAGWTIPTQSPSATTQTQAPVTVPSTGLLGGTVDISNHIGAPPPTPTTAPTTAPTPSATPTPAVTPTTAPATAPTQPANMTAAQIGAIFNVAYGRAPTASEISHWTSQPSSGVINSIVSSPEAVAFRTGKTAQSPAPAAAPATPTMAPTAAPTAAPATATATAPVAQSPGVTSPSTYDKIVRNFYTTYLGREPDAEGLAYWTERAKQPGVDMFALQKEFVESGKARGEAVQGLNWN